MEKKVQGGLALMWNENVTISLRWKNERITCREVNVEGRAWVLFGCYAIPYLSEKETFWDLLGKIVEAKGKPWIVMGDLNEVMEGSEKFGGRSIDRRKLYLIDFVLNVGAVDLGYSAAVLHGITGMMGIR